MWRYWIRRDVHRDMHVEVLEPHAWTFITSCPVSIQEKGRRGVIGGRHDAPVAFFIPFYTFTAQPNSKVHSPSYAIATMSGLETDADGIVGMISTPAGILRGIHQELPPCSQAPLP